MNDPTPFLLSWAQRLPRVTRRCRAALRQWRQVIRSWAPVEHWVALVRGPLWAGVSLQSDRWQLVLHEPLKQGTASAGHAEADAWARLQHRLWRPVPDLTVSKDLTLDGPLPETDRAAWWSALQGIRHVLPPDACHLVLSWPDEALWSTSITLTAPLTAAELPALLEQELASVMPAPLDRTAWDARWPQPSSLASWSGWLGWGRWVWQGMERMTRPASQWEDDVMVPCWAMPLALARQLDAMGRALGFASLSIEPHSVSLARASTVQRSRLAGATAPQVLEAVPPLMAAAFGAACRAATGGPDLLRHLRTEWTHPWRNKIRQWWPWVLGLVMAAGMGHALGGLQVERWSQEQEAWEQRLRQLQAVHAAQAQHRRSVQQARTRHQQQEERVAHNLRFAQVLQGWAATVPPGVRWQQLSLRPHQLELQAQALDAERLTRWMGRWPHTLPAGGQHQLQWQPSPAGAGDGAVDVWVSLTVQWSWGPVTGARE